MNESLTRWPTLLVKRLFIISILILFSMASFEAGCRYERYRLSTERASSPTILHILRTRTLLPVGFYYGKLKGLLFSVTVARNGSLEVNGDFQREGLRGFNLQYHPTGQFGVPSVSFATNLVTGTRDSTRKIWAFLLKDLGVWGRPSFEARTIENGKAEQLWRLRGNWVCGAKVTPPFLEYAGVRYRYDALSGGWRRTVTQ